MKYEDTVIGGEHLADLVAMDNAAGPVDEMGRRGTEKREAALLQAQAEITWDKAIKEVVEWITAHSTDLSLVSSSHSGLCFSIIEWQAKLKSWGFDGH